MKKCLQILLLLIGAVTAAVCWLDVTRWIDPVSGFAQAGTIWVRYGAVIVVYLLACAVAALNRRKTGLQNQKNVVAAIAAWLCGAAYTVIGTLRLAKVFPVLQEALHAGKMYSTSAGQSLTMEFWTANGGDLIMGIFALLGAWTLFVQSDFWRNADQGQQPAGGVYFAATGLLYLCGLAFERFLTHTSSVYRVYHILQLFSVMIGLLFMLSMLRVCFFPETDRANVCVRNGLGCFYLCTCCEMVFSIFQWSRGLLPMGDWMNSILLGLTGLLGLAYSLPQINPEENMWESTAD